MRIKVEVTSEDIRLGRRGDGKRCPVARATNRALIATSGYPTFDIYQGIVSLSVKLIDFDYLLFSDWVDIPMPRSVQRFIDAFDIKRPVKPFNFYINI